MDKRMVKVQCLIAGLDTENGKAPEWMLLFAAGTGTLEDGSRFLVDETACTLIAEQIASRGNEIHFDYEHASIQEKAALAQGAPAAGWIKELKWEGGRGIMARVAWTDKAAAHIAAREYRYFSPVFYMQKQDKRVCGLDSVALTNRPRTNFLTPILASLEARLGKTKEEIMDREKLIAALGLDNDATDAMIVAAVVALGVVLPETAPKEVIPRAVTAALGCAESDTASVVVASIHALKQEKSAGVSKSEFNALKQKLADRDARDAVTAAMAAGKITPDQEDWAMEYAGDDPEGFKVFVAKAPQVVPVDKLPGKTDDPEDNGKVDDVTLEVAGMMGVSKEDIEKYGN